ncbi:hypothetical protein RN001_000934 [Aquatica leii]|uniref:Uncharacterized protein n=1 Tax=Aquatica leii TaxID=1421715 RepID=A0AAN7PFV6_9COLE|nr:hypothetical protein RN001_000934 [Aquatica leii]
MEDLVELMQFEALEDEVLDNMLLMLMRRPKRIRAEQYGRFNLDGMCAEDIKLNFRFEKDDLERLARALRIPAQVRTENRHATTAIEALCPLTGIFKKPYVLTQYRFNQYSSAK